MNNTIKSKINVINALYKKQIQNGRFESDIVFLVNLITELKDLISSMKALTKIPLIKIFKTQSRLVSLDFNEDGILKIIRALNICT